ncbi:MAG: SGNH/GDSL hydrolase family protein, partial [Vicinamibacterales bacterium]
PQDTVFWAILGGFVVYGGLRELNAARKPRRIAGQQGWNRSRGLQTAITFTMFYTLWSLWSTESMNLWLWMLGAAANVDLKGVVLFGGAFLTMMVLGGIDWKAAGPRQGWQGMVLSPASRTVVPLLVLCALAQPAVQASIPHAMADAVRTMQATGLNARDLTLQHRGYYEQLDVRAQLDTPVTADGRKRDASWQTLDQLGLLNERHDLMLRDLKPSRRTTWNGQQFTTNRWGMRDQDYSRDKAPGTLRIAILGPSHVMGNNVADGDVFEQLVEQRLNRDGGAASYPRVEFLNFGVDGYSLPQQLALLEDRVFAFSPDIVIATHYKDNRDMTEGFLLKVSDQGIPVPVPEIAAIMSGAGLLDPGHAGVPLPYAMVRRAAGALGVPSRMPYGEARSRARRVADDVLAASFRRFAAMTRARGVTPVVLALNVVLDDVPAEVPLRSVIDEASLPVFDLFDVFPVDQRPALRVAPWDDHPNAAGHRLVAEALYRKLTAFLSSGALPRGQALPSPRP